MSSATTSPAMSPPSFSARLFGVLEILLAGRGCLDFEAWSEDGFSQRSFRVAQLEPGWLPPLVLDAIEDDMSIRLVPATIERGGGVRPLSLSALFARFLMQPVRTRHGDEIPAAAFEEIARRLEAFLPPSALIDGAREVVALWRLDRPLDLRRGFGQALDLQERLAGALGASTSTVRHVSPSASPGVRDIRALAAHDPTLPIPLAGPVRGWDGPAPLVEIVSVDPSRTYSLEEIESAIQESSK